MEKQRILELTAEITSAFVAGNETRADQIPVLIETTFKALSDAIAPPPAVPEYVPAVNPKKSVRDDAIISLIDGKPYKMLKRHLTTQGLTPAEYRERYGLPSDYPMVAPDYAAVRARLAKEIGLGHHPKAGRGRTAAH